MQIQSLKATDIKENYSLADLLSRLGYEPVKRIGKEMTYLSMLNDSDTTPSFFLDDKQGTWYDFSEGKGGNIIDFAIQYWPGLSFPEVLEKIVSVSGSTTQYQYRRQPAAHKEPNYRILDVKDIGSNAVISQYLESRGVGEVARGRLKEIYYHVVDDNNKKNKFFAAGWQNESGAWEIRNLNFKGCLGHKAISFIPNSEKRLSVFEGFFNYLSWLTANKFAPDSVLVLNSTSLLQAGIAKAHTFAQVDLHFDHDQTGRNATSTFIAEVPWAIDRSAVYAGYNDYNELIVAERNQQELSR